MAAGTFPDRIAAAASFHGGGLATDAPDSPHLLAAKIRASVYIGVAGIDPYFPDSEKERLQSALETAGVRYQLEVYPGVRHGFTMTDVPVYDREAAERHWQKLLQLLRKARRGTIDLGRLWDRCRDTNSCDSTRPQSDTDKWSYASAMRGRLVPISAVSPATRLADFLDLVLCAVVIGAAVAAAPRIATTQPAASTAPSATTKAFFPSVRDLANLSLEDLMSIEITADHN